MLITMDIRHCLKILLWLTFCSSVILGVAGGGSRVGRDEDFAIDVPSPEFSKSGTSEFSPQTGNNEDLVEKKTSVTRLRSPQLIPDRNIDGVNYNGQRKKPRRKRPKKKCAPGEFWHSRGLKCVPKRCPEGTARKSLNDGECIEHEVGGRQMRRFSGYQRGSNIWKRKQKVVYHGLPPRFGPGMGRSGRF